MSSRFAPVTDEQIFLLDEAAVPTPPNTKKARFFCLKVYVAIISY
jgi:hypothetical protein